MKGLSAALLMPAKTAGTRHAVDHPVCGLAIEKVTKRTRAPRLGKRFSASVMSTGSVHLLGPSVLSFTPSDLAIAERLSPSLRR